MIESHPRNIFLYRGPCSVSHGDGVCFSVGCPSAIAIAVHVLLLLPRQAQVLSPIHLDSADQSITTRNTLHSQFSRVRLPSAPSSMPRSSHHESQESLHQSEEAHMIEHSDSRPDPIATAHPSQSLDRIEQFYDPTPVTSEHKVGRLRPIERNR